MKKPPCQVAPPQSRFRSRQAKVTTQQDPDKLDQLKAQLPHYLERYHTDRIAKRSPHKLMLHCPFHEDRSPSFTADDSKGTWLFKCFSCGRAGSLIDLHAECASLKPRTAEALQSTAQAVGMEFSLSPALTPAERKQWARRKQDAERAHAKHQKKATQQKLLTDHQQRTLPDKLKPYLSKDWRADLWHSSPIWTETPSDSTLTFLNILFPPGALLWMGEPYDTGQEKHRRHFKTCQEWLKVSPLPPRLAAGCFRPDSYSRSIANLESSSFLIIESDDLIGRKPTNAGERAQNKALSYALALYCQDKLGLHLRAVIDTGNKSLHLWFDRPPAKELAAIRQLAPGLRIDTGLLDSCATAPLRMPGCIHEKTHLPATLLYLDLPAS